MTGRQKEVTKINLSFSKYFEILWSIIEFKSINLQTKNILHCNYKDNGYLGVKDKYDFLNVMKYSLTKRIKKRVNKN